MGVWAALRQRVVGASPSDDLHGVALTMAEAERDLYAAYDGVRKAMRGADAPAWPGAVEAWDRLSAVLDRYEPTLREALTTGVGESVLRLRLLAVESLRGARAAAAEDDGETLADMWAAGTKAWNDSQDEADRLMGRRPLVSGRFGR